MAAYIRWLAPQIEELKTTIPEHLRELRAKAREHSLGHDRTPDIVASLALGWETFLRFAREANAITDDEFAVLQERSWKMLLEAAKAQARHQVSEEPTSRFLTLLSSAISSGQAHIAAAAMNEEPETPQNWGWRKVMLRSDITNQWQPKGDLVGWVDGDNVYLDPDCQRRSKIGPKGGVKLVHFL